MKTECAKEVQMDTEMITENNDLHADAVRALADAELLLVGGGGGDVVFG